MKKALLSDVYSSLESGSRPKGGIVEGNGDIPSLGAEHLNDAGGFNFAKPKLIPLSYYSSMTKGRIKKGDILIVKDGATTGKVSFVTEEFPYVEAAINEHVFCLRLDEKKTLPKYVFWYLKSPSGQYQILNDFRGATVGGISRGFMDKVEFPLPILGEQRRIAAILDKADAIRRKRQESISLTEELIRAVFLDMFGDPVTNKKGWPIRQLADVGTLDRGVSKNRPRNAPELLGGPYPLIQTGDVASSDGYIRSYKSTYSETGLKQSKMWPAGTLCITIAANIAKTGILTFAACFPDSVVGFTPNGSATTEYVQHWLGFLQKTLEDNAPESAQKNINLEILRKLDMPVPDIKLQEEFTRRVKATQDLKSKLNGAVDQQAQLFESLSQRAFRGEL